MRLFALILFTAKLTEQVLKDWGDKELTGYKRPKYIESRDELLKYNVGKILRRNQGIKELKKNLYRLLAVSCAGNFRILCYTSNVPPTSGTPAALV